MDESNDVFSPSDDAEQSITESNERFRILIEGVRDYAIYMLDPAGRIVSWNTGAQNVKGYSKNEVIGQHFSLFFTAEDAVLSCLQCGRTPDQWFRRWVVRCQRIGHAPRGTVDVMSEEGHGSTFIITLPLMEDQKSDLLEPSDAHQEPGQD